MSEQDNINIVRKEFDAINSHNPEMTVQNLADNGRVMDIGYPDVLDKQKALRSHRMFLSAFPDLHFDLKDLIAQGDKVAASWEAHGTHRGPLEMPDGQTVPATNRAIHIPGVTFYEMRQGMVMREDIYYDQIAFLTQLGLLTPQDITSMIRR